MKLKSQITGLLLVGLCSLLPAQVPFYKSKAYSIYPDRVVQGNFVAKAISSTELTSNYRSPDADKYSPTITFKFSINCRDNEMPSGKDHKVTLIPESGKCVTNVTFGQQFYETSAVYEGINLHKNTIWTIRLDMRSVINAFKNKGYFTFYNGDKLYSADFKGVYIGGNSAPLIWDFNNLYTKAELELKDPDGDGIYETKLIMNAQNAEKQTDPHWELTKDISAFPQYKSDFPISDAIYNLATEEMIKAVEPDSTFRTGKEWAGVWTRDISYSIILSMAYLQPKVAKYSLLRKVKNGRIIQDTGTGGAYPVSTDRIVWAVAAWELFKATGDNEWLAKSYQIIKNSLEDDLKNAYDPQTGMVKGESSFLDWREQTYPRWMQPADIYESENLGTNAVHYQANVILSKMAMRMNDKITAKKHLLFAEEIKAGINKYLWLKDKGYYGQYLYGRNFKIVAPRAEALGEALCVWFGIADKEKATSIISKVPIMDFGISCIYPQIPNIPPYHNNAVWPFVQTYWGLASAKAGNEKSVMECISAVYRPVALFLTNKENFVATIGDFAGTQINSSNMLWSLSGSMALVHKVLFGIEFGTDSLNFHPFVPEALSGKRSLTNFKYRNTILNIEMEGFGNQIQRFELDNKENAVAAIPYSLNGKHTIKIVLSGTQFPPTKINKVANYTTVETPVVAYNDGQLQWTQVSGAVLYRVLINGQQLTQTSTNFLKVTNENYTEYQVLAVDSDRIESFASEPVIVNNSTNSTIYELENYASKSLLNYKNFHGEGFTEISKSVNQTIKIPVEINKSGIYSLNFRYSNGNGPVNTENKCAIRSLEIDGDFEGTIVLPQRGKNEWSNWGNTNSIKVKLFKGRHTISVIFQPQNENMNGETNQAMLDEMNIFKIN